MATLAVYLDKRHVWENLLQAPVTPFLTIPFSALTEYRVSGSGDIFEMFSVQCYCWM